MKQIVLPNGKTLTSGDEIIYRNSIGKTCRGKIIEIKDIGDFGWLHMLSNKKTEWVSVAVQLQYMKQELMLLNAA